MPSKPSIVERVGARDLVAQQRLALGRRRRRVVAEARAASRARGRRGPSRGPRRCRAGCSCAASPGRAPTACSGAIGSVAPSTRRHDDADGAGDAVAVDVEVGLRRRSTPARGRGACRRRSRRSRRAAAGGGAARSTSSRASRERGRRRPRTTPRRPRSAATALGSPSSTRSSSVRNTRYRQVDVVAQLARQQPAGDRERARDALGRRARLDQADVLRAVQQHARAASASARVSRAAIEPGRDLGAEQHAGMPAPGCVPPPTKYSPRTAGRGWAGAATPTAAASARRRRRCRTPRRGRARSRRASCGARRRWRRRGPRGRTSSRGPSTSASRRRSDCAVPVDPVPAQVGHRQQHAQRVAAGRRPSPVRVRAGACTYVENVGAIRRRAGDVADEAPVAAADEQRVVQQRVERAVRAEVQQEARHRRRQAPQRRAPPERARACAGRRRSTTTTSAAIRSPPSSTTPVTAPLPVLDARRRASPQRTSRRARHRLDDRVDPAAGVPDARRGTAGRRALHRWLVRETGRRR